MPNTVILATQRTGSTLLCSEFTAIGGLGRPGEHFLGWLRAAGEGARLPRSDFEAALEAGRAPDGSVGVKLMADYLPTLGAAWRAPAPESPEAAAVAFLEALAEEIGPLAVFRIDRSDRFDQALSRYLAAATGVYFKTVEGSEVRREGQPTEPGERLLDGLTPQRLEAILGKIDRECGRLDAIAERLPWPVLSLSYEALVEDRDRVLAACCAHAGVPAPTAWPERWMKKVVDRDLRDRFRRRAETLWAERIAKGASLPETSKLFEPA